MIVWVEETDAGVSANTMQRRITRYRRGEQYPELSGEEQAALRGGTGAVAG